MHDKPVDPTGLDPRHELRSPLDDLDLAPDLRAALVDGREARRAELVAAEERRAAAVVVDEDRELDQPAPAKVFARCPKCRQQVRVRHGGEFAWHNLRAGIKTKCEGSNKPTPAAMRPLSWLSGDGLEGASLKARMELLRIPPCVPHATIPLQRMHELVATALDSMPKGWLWRFRKLSMHEGLAAALACFNQAVYAPCRFVGGCDDARGFDAPGNEWARFAAMLMGRDSYSSRHLSRTFERWEGEGRGVRKQNLAELPPGEVFVCPKRGTEHHRKFERNWLYPAAVELAAWSDTRWMRPLASAIRSLVPTDLWIKTDKARTWRRHGLSYRDTLTNARAELGTTVARRRGLAERRKRARTVLAQQIRGRRPSNVPSFRSAVGSESEKSQGPKGRAAPALAGELPLVAAELRPPAGAVEGADELDRAGVVAGGLVRREPESPRWRELLPMELRKPRDVAGDGPRTSERLQERPQRGARAPTPSAELWARTRKGESDGGTD